MADIYTNEIWDEVELKIPEAKGMYWDGCHKIYLAMDDKQVAQQEDYGYEYHRPNLALLKEWFEQSCFLRFITTIYSNPEDPNAGYVDIIPQFYFEEEEDEQEKG